MNTIDIDILEKWPQINQFRENSVLAKTGAEFVVPFSSRFCSLAPYSSWKSHQMAPFFIQKDILGEKIIIWVKNGNVFTQMIMFSL